MFSTLRKLFCFKKEPKTPLGFCDGPSSGKGSLSCCDCGTEDRYQPPYDPDNKFHEAVCQGRIKTVLKLLSKKFDVNDKDKRGRTALHFACFYGHLHLVYFLLHNECDVNELDDQKSTPLMKAVQSWETKIVSVLLDNEANPNIKDSKGETALHHAVYVDRPDIVTILLKFGGNIEETTKDGFTPLLLALRERKLLMSEHLIAHGANVYACDAFLRTTLMYAVKWDSEDIVEILLKKDVDYSLKDIFGWNALQYAMAGKRKVKSIILEYEDSLFSSQHSVFVGKQLGDISQSGHYLKSESLISVCSRTGEANFETQYGIPENIPENDADDLPIASEQYENLEAQEEELELETIPDLELENENVYSKNEGYQKLDASRKAAHSSNIGNDTEKNEINQVWAEKCPHPELRDYSHPISKPKSEPLKYEPDLYEELKEEIPKSKLKNERSFDKNAENQEFSVSDANGQQEASMEALCSSNMNDEAEENVIRHLEKKTVMEDQKQTSGEEQKQHSGGKTKRSFEGTEFFTCSLEAKSVTKMKRAKHLSTTSKKLTSVPELPFKKGLLNSSPKLKEKRNAKPLHDKTEPMVLRSPPTGESIVRYALPIPSSKTKDLIAEDEMVRRIAKHLKTVVTALEDTYGAVDEDGERTSMRPKAEGVSLSVGDDMNSFLLCCSQFAAQLEEAVKEERNILESLFKWFQQQVNQMEEIGKDQSILEADLPSDDKSVHLNIVQIANLVHKFEDLKSRLREHKGSLVSKYVDKETPSVPVKTYEGVEKQIEDFIKSHSTFESQVDSETEPEAPYSVTDRMNVMMNIFKNQTNMLERALNDQSIIETKYKQMEADFQILLLEKTLLEGEIRKLRESEKAKPASKEDRSKKPAKPEKKKDKDSERKTSPSREVELLQIQKEAEALKMEKKALQEQLKWALQEAERNKTQLDYVLHQEMEAFKEEKNKTKLERASSKSKVKGETSKQSHSAEKVAQPSEQKQDSGKISPEKGERLVDESLEKRRSISADLDPSALEGFYGVSDVSAFPQEVFKSFTALPFIEERLESSSPLPKEMEMWSLVSFPDLAKEIEKAEASEQILFHTDEENSEAPYEGLDESYAQEDKDLLPEDEASRAKQLSDRGRRKPLFITAKRPEFLSLLSRTQSEIENLEAVKYENVTNEYEEKSAKEDSKTEIKSKGQKGSKTGKLHTHAEESEETPKAKASAKKRDTAKRKGLAPPDADAEGSISPGSQASSTKSDTQTKKHRLHKRERPILPNGMPDKSFEPQDAVLKSESQAKKLKFSKTDVISSEVSDRNMRPEDQNVQSSSQIQLKKQRSLGGEILTTPDESYAHLHSELSSESQAQLERGTTSEDARLSRIPSEYQKKDLSVDNLLPEKKPLIITRNVSQNKKSGFFRDDNAENENVMKIFLDEDLESESRDPKAKDKTVIEVQEIPERQKTLNPIISDLIFRLDMDNVVENKLDNLRNMFGQHLLRSEFKPQSKSGSEIGKDRKGTSAKSKSTAKTDATSKELTIIKGTKLLEQLKDEHDVGLLKIKPQENITTKYQPPKKFPTKVINLSPFLTSQEENVESSSYTDEIQKPLYRTSRGSSGIPATFQQMINSRKIAGQSKHRKLRKKGAESQSSIHPSASSIKKQKLKEQPKPVKLVEKRIKLPNNLKMPASTPKIKVIKELSKTSHLEGEDVKLSNNPSKSKSAIKKFLTEEPPKPVNLNDQDAIILYNLRGLTYATNKDLSKELSRSSYFYGDVAQHSSIMSMSAARKSETKETFKLTNLDEKDDGAADNLQMSNLAATLSALKEPTKPSDLDKSAVDILHMSTSALIQYFKASSKTSDIGKKVSKRSNTLHKSTSSVKKRVRKGPSKTKKLGKKVGEGTPTPRRLTPAKKKRVLKEPSKTSNLDKQSIKGTKILRKSNSALKKRVPKETSKTSNLDKQSIKGTNTLRKSNSALKKRVPKGQPKPTTLDKKGVGLPNNLVSSTSASSKHRFKG